MVKYDTAERQTVSSQKQARRKQQKYPNNNLSNSLRNDKQKDQMMT